MLTWHGAFAAVRWLMGRPVAAHARPTSGGGGAALREGAHTRAAIPSHVAPRRVLLAASAVCSPVAVCSISMLQATDYLNARWPVGGIALVLLAALAYAVNAPSRRPVASKAHAAAARAAAASLKASPAAPKAAKAKAAAPAPAAAKAKSAPAAPVAKPAAAPAAAKAPEKAAAPKAPKAPAPPAKPAAPKAAKAAKPAVPPPAPPPAPRVASDESEESEGSDAASDAEASDVMWALAASGAARKGVVAAPAVGDSSPAKGDWEVRPARGDAARTRRRGTPAALRSLGSPACAAARISRSR